MDEHTVSCSLRPDGKFDTVRTHLGELVYELKYKFDRSKIEPVAEIAAEYIKGLLVYPYLAAIIPVPPSDTSRPYQPVIEVASAVGKITGKPAPSDFLFKKKTTSGLKNIDDPKIRREQLKDAFGVKDKRFSGRYVLLFDDLYRSGETFSEAVNALHEQGGVERVFVLALTRTRVKK